MRCYVPDYELRRARSLVDALEMLGSGDGWRPIAGGTDLMVLFNAGKLPFEKFVSVRDVSELRTIIVTDSEVRLGGAVTYTQIRQHATLQREFPLLCLAASWTGGIANQNRGTVGGNIVNASPAADSSPALLVYDAEITLISTGGARSVPYRQFHTGYRQTQLRPDELVSEIRLPRRRAHWRHYGRKVGPRKAQAISKVCLAAGAELEDGHIADIRIAVGSVAPVPLRCIKTEAMLRGGELRTGLLAQAQELIRTEIQPITDIRSTEEYRTLVVANLLTEFLQGVQ
ncbi:MAG: xanthine dehydrogenase family protein subunit M [Acidobacteriaceae bacterium]|nr:xanthine dehydrogenase family protein subunit M [Acidobacteriaceae bacterium]